MSDLFDVPPQKAHARRTDPDTSHRAAREVTPHTDTIRADVERWARARGAEGFIDEELSAAFDANDVSSYRTRRGELTQAQIVLDTGRRRMNSKMRQCIVWVHHSLAGRVVGAEPPLTMRDKLLRHANRLDGSAVQMKHEGRAAFHDELRETAALIREAVEATAKREKSAG